MCLCTYMYMKSKRYDSCLVSLIVKIYITERHVVIKFLYVFQGLRSYEEVRIYSFRHN